MSQPPSSDTPAAPIATRLNSLPRGTRAGLAQTLLLAAILLCGAALRFYNIAWDSGTLPHPDERSTVAFYAPSMRWPADLEQALDPRQSPLNPFWDPNAGHRRSYTYGHFPLYTLALTGAAAESLAPLAEQLGLPPDVIHFMNEARSPYSFARIGRFLVALFDTASIYLLFLLGRRLYGTWAGLLAASFSAFTVLQIQLAHFFAVDPISAAFVLLALYGSVLMADRRTAGAAVLTGVAIGLAVASKFSALPIAAAPVVAVALSLSQAEAGVPRPIAGRRWSHLLLALCVALVVFAITSPFVFLDFSSFWQAVVREQGDMVSGVADFPFTRQYRGTPAYLYFLEQQILWGMGVPLGLLSLGGLAWVVWRAVRRQADIGEYIILSWLVLYFGPTGLFLAKFMRYMAPVVPLLVLFGAGLVTHGSSRQRSRDARARVQPAGLTDLSGEEEGESRPHPVEGSGVVGLADSAPVVAQPAAVPELTGDRGSQPRPRPVEDAGVVRLDDAGPGFAALQRVLRYVAGGLALLWAIVWSFAFVSGVYGSEHAWVTASRWVYQNIPDGACIAGEHWEEGFPQSWPEPGMSAGAHGYRQPLLPMYEEDTPAKLQQIRETLKNCDYLVLASNRLWRTIPQLPERYPMSARYYQVLFDGELGFEQVYTWATPPRLGPLVIDDQEADESFTVYDHPRPIIFKKVRQLSDAEWDDLLGGLWEKATPGYVGSPTVLMWLSGWQRGDGARQSPGEREAASRKPLLLDTPVDSLPVVDDYRWNGLANGSTVAAIAIWWLAVQVTGWLAWPLARRLFDGLADQGYLLAKSLGWLLIGYGVWLPSSLYLLPNALPTALGGLALLAALAVWLSWRDWRRLAELLVGRWRLILIGEAVFGLTYLWFVGLRVLNPDLWQPWNGGEKMLEVGFLNAVVKSAHMPPYDPYFAGGYVNYYYYGLFLVGVVIKLTGIQPTIAFNLAVPTVAALTAGNVFCLACNLGAGASGWTRGKTPEGGNRHGRAPFEAPHPPALSPSGGEGEPEPLSGGLLHRASSPTFSPCSGERDTARAGGGVTARGVLVGLLAVLFVVLVGNLAGLKQLLRMLGDVSGSSFSSGLPWIGEVVRALGGLLLAALDGVRLPAYNYWDPTRVIPDTINEFPYFSFLFADLHPHMIGMPFTVLVLTLAYGLLATRRRGISPPDYPHAGVAAQDGGRLGSGHNGRLLLDALSWGHLGRWLALAFCLGALAVINTWDLPTYVGLATFAFWLSRYRREGESAANAATEGRRWPARLLRPTLQAVLFGALTLAACYALYLPFFTHYQPLDVGLGLVGDRTDLGQFLLIWGLFLFVGLSSMGVAAIHPRSRFWPARALSLLLRRWNVLPHLMHLGRPVAPRAGRGRIVAWWVLLAVLAVTVLAWALGYQVVGLLLPLVCLAFLLLLRPELTAEATFAGVLLFAGLLILLGVEVFYMRDFLGGSSYYRMNTLFKFYIQVWVMFGVVGAVLTADRWERAAIWRRPFWSLAWRVSLAGLVAASLVYPVLGTRTRVQDRFDDPPPLGTLDGMAYMTTGTLAWPQGERIELKYDYQAIQWLQAHVTGTPVLAEAKIGYYREGGMRVASYTGLPMPLGGLHQSEQRWPDQIGQRDGLYMEFWNTSDVERAWSLIQQLDISYVYIGQLEHTLYDPDLTALLQDWGVTHFAPTGYDKFEQLLSQRRLEVAYENERTRIYRVVSGG